MLRSPALLSILALAACGRSPQIAPTASAATPPAASAARAPSDAPATGAPAASTAPPATLPGHHHDLADPELVHFAGSRGSLGGFLYKPKGAGPFPAVVFNHGSEQLPGNKYGQALFFVSRGFVLFVPHRLGHGQSPGEYVMDAVEREPSASRDAKLVSVLDAQVQDVADATAYVEALPFVNRSAVAMVGCSFGGIETVLAAERDLGLRAAVNFSGAAQTWGENALLRDRLQAAARSAKTPIFFLQASNDYDTRPSLELSRVMDAAGKPHQVKIFPPHGTTAEEGHGFCRGGVDPDWGGDVLAFLAKNGVEGAQPK